MSGRRALLLTLRDLLRARSPLGLSLTEAECNLAPGGRPPPLAGDWFYGLSCPQRNGSARTSFMEFPTVQVMLSARAGKVPLDRLGEMLIEGEGGVSDRLAALVTFVARKQYDWINAATAMLQKANGPTNGFILPAFEFTESEGTEVSPDHWRSIQPNMPGRVQAAPPGVMATVQFTGFKREQYLESAT